MKLTFRKRATIAGTIIACTHTRIVGWFAICPAFAGTAFERMHLN